MHLFIRTWLALRCTNNCWKEINFLRIWMTINPNQSWLSKINQNQSKWTTLVAKWSLYNDFVKKEQQLLGLDVWASLFAAPPWSTIHYQMIVTSFPSLCPCVFKGPNWLKHKHWMVFYSNDRPICGDPVPISLRTWRISRCSTMTLVAGSFPFFSH
jgi:hypothetical protein